MTAVVTGQVGEFPDESSQGVGLRAHALPMQHPTTYCQRSFRDETNGILHRSKATGATRVNDCKIFTQKHAGGAIRSCAYSDGHVHRWERAAL